MGLSPFRERAVLPRDCTGHANGGVLCTATSPLSLQRLGKPQLMCMPVSKRLRAEWEIKVQKQSRRKSCSHLGMTWDRGGSYELDSGGVNIGHKSYDLVLAL